MLPTDWLTWLKDRPRCRPSARRRRREQVPRGWVDDMLLEKRCLLSGFLMPHDTVPPAIGVTGVLYDGGLVTPTASTQQFVKHITITNNGPETIYPFLEDANNRTAKPGDPTPAPNLYRNGDV